MHRRTPPPPGAAFNLNAARPRAPSLTSDESIAWNPVIVTRTPFSLRLLPFFTYLPSSFSSCEYSLTVPRRNLRPSFSSTCFLFSLFFHLPFSVRSAREERECPVCGLARNLHAQSLQ